MYPMRFCAIKNIEHGFAMSVRNAPTVAHRFSPGLLIVVEGI
jgi:hypothetical protein